MQVQMITRFLSNVIATSTQIHINAMETSIPTSCNYLETPATGEGKF